MKILTSLIVGGSLLIGSALAQDSKSPAKPAAAATTQAAPAKGAATTPAPAKVKKHHKHKKAAPAANAKPAVTKPAATSTAKPAAVPATPAK